jgi:3-oxoacyl-[acyl-carrier protein] reductase
VTSSERPVAIVTGAGSGIGAATARALARSGWDVGLVGRRDGPLDAVATELRAIGASAHVAPADLAHAGAPRAVVEAVAQRLGRVDDLVANAATVTHQPLEDWPVDDDLASPGNRRRREYPTAWADSKVHTM